MDPKDNNAKLAEYVRDIQESIEKIKPEDSRCVFIYENIKVASVIENLNRIAARGKKIKYLYVELSDVADKST
jgi:hypothetical protein